MSQIWKLKGDLDTIDLGNGYFLVKFANMEDAEVARLEGLWSVDLRQPLSLRFKNGQLSSNLQQRKFPTTCG
ncbi:hypothetical protein L1049_006521 [Liquidambar formosana]|uniref:DUF4283 domain-containing protein n=1 Tax=Liquidambar formosana TaxID=63359 RepID=A0AAP0WR42_LIQFO